MFIEPEIRDIKKAKELNSDCIEIHTGKICNLINKKKSFKKEIKRIKIAAAYADNLDLEVHAGHGLTYKSAKILKGVKEISEFNIGHFLVSESIFVGFTKSIRNFKRLIN